MFELANWRAAAHGLWAILSLSQRIDRTKKSARKSGRKA
jgi:hypothetical protein